VAIGLECGIVFCHNQEVQKLIDIIGIQGLLEAIKQILIGPTSVRSPGFKIGYKLTEGALALLHSDDLVLCVGLRTDRLCQSSVRKLSSEPEPMNQTTSSGSVRF
jgi:hypothetical protein